MHNNSLVTAVVSQQLHTGWPVNPQAIHATGCRLNLESGRQT